MKHLLKNSRFLFAIGAFAFAGFPAASFAQAPLEVQFQNGSSPIFTVTDFAPGDTAEGWIEVTNNSGESQDIITEAINVSDPDNLGGAMTLSITGDASGEVYNNVFSHFLTSGEIGLSSLSANSTERYTYKVTFNESAGNDLQGTDLGFDICIGFKAASGGTHCGGTVVSDENNTGGGGGGGGSSPTLIIKDEEVESVNPGLGSAVIVWDTNLLSTSQVVFGPASGSYTLDLNDIYFGYPFGTTEDTLKVYDHTVVITGLVPGAEYKYRVISRASPPTVSFEHTFAVPGSEPAPFEIPANPAPAAPASNPQGELGGSELPEITATTTENPSIPNLAAAAFFGLPANLTGNLICAGVALLMLLIIYFGWTLSLGKSEKSDADARILFWKKISFIVAGSAIAVFLLYLFNYPCPIPYFAVFSIILLLATVWKHVQIARS